MSFKHSLLNQHAKFDGNLLATSKAIAIKSITLLIVDMVGN